jgi:hypothetical protein
MEWSRTFDVPVSEQVARTRMKTYLEGAGYRPSSLASLSYERGSPLGSRVSFSPRGWQAEIRLAAEPTAADKTQVSVALNVNTKGQWLTGPEQGFWDKELDGLEAAARSGVADYGPAAKAARTATWLSLLALPVLAIDVALVAALGFLAFFWFVVGGLSTDDLVEIRGTLTDYQQTEAGDLVLHLEGHSNAFRASPSDMPFLDVQGFRQQTQGGQLVYLGLTKGARDSLYDQSSETAVTVLGIRSDAVTFMAPEVLLTERTHRDRRLILLLLLACIVILVPMLFITAKIGLLSSVRQNLANYLGSRRY